MSGTGGFPIDVVLFGLIAAFLVLRLRSILGRRTGFERQQSNAPVQVPGMGRPTSPVIDVKAEPAAPDRPLPDGASAIGQTLARMRAADRSFDPARFLANAEAAFRIIVNAFAAGDRDALRPLLGDETFRGFDQAITTRQAEGQTQRTEIRAIPQVQIVGAALSGMLGSITVRFVSDQVSETVDRDGKPVGGTDAVTEIIDLWTFERNLGQSDPAWRLAAARSG